MWLSASRLQTLDVWLLLDALVMLEVGTGRDDYYLHDAGRATCWSGEKLETGFFLGAELDRKTRRQARGKSFSSASVPQCRAAVGLLPSRSVRLCCMCDKRWLNR